MSIKEEFVEVVLHSSNIKHYENKGYKELIDSLKYYDKQYKKWKIKRGTKILVKVSDLPKWSNVKITAICECPTCKHPERILEFYQYTDICIDCQNHSEEHRIKHTGENSPMFGKKLSEETKRKMSNAKKGKYKGKDHPSWNPNKTDKERINGRYIQGFSKWLKDVKERDNYICQCCGFIGAKKDGILNAHHLNNYIDFPEQRIDLNNGITLCKTCHSSANGYSYHTINGNKENTIKQFYQWFLSILEFENTII